MLLLFSESILLTPSPITLTEKWVDIIPSKSIEAIAGGAALYVDISNFVKKYDYEKLREQFPQNTIEAKLIAKAGNEFTIANIDGFSKSKDQICIIVAGKEEIPTNLKFSKIRIKSNIDLYGVSIIWRNGSL